MKNKVFNFFVVLGKIGVVLLPLLLIGFIALFWFKKNFQSPVDYKATNKTKFVIEAGATLDQIAKNLENKKLVNSAYAFKWFAKKQKNKKISAGEYSISASQTPKSIVLSLLSGKTINYTLEIKPCQTIKEISESISKINLLTKEEAFDAFKNPRLMSELGIPAYIPEGYLIEGKYEFNKPRAPEELIKKLLNQSKVALDKKIPKWIDRADELGYRPYEILVLASLIDKEAGESSTELAAISSVYHNRLKIGMQLQSKKALRYGVPDLKEELSDNDMLEETPYNTFINIGLPPTPICSASAASIYAALFPAETDSLYFLKNKDGRVEYSTSFKEHQSKLKAQN